MCSSTIITQLQPSLPPKKYCLGFLDIYGVCGVSDELYNCSDEDLDWVVLLDVELHMGVHISYMLLTFFCKEIDVFVGGGTVLEG